MQIESESSLGTTIAENLTLGTYVCQDNKLIYLNQRFADIFGFPDRNSLLQRNLFTEVYPDAETLDLFKDMHDKMISEDISHTGWAQPSAREDGTIFWMEIEAKRVELNGKPAIIGTFKDQTDCQIMAEAMVISQQTLRLLLDAMEDRVYVVSNDHKIVYANKKMLESCHGDINTDPCHKLCRGSDTPCEDCSRDDVFKSDQPLYKEFFNPSNNAWYSVIEMGIRMPGINQPAKLAVARDITNRKEYEQRIRALSHRLLNAQEDERKFISRELHDDLGQRLNAVKMATETLAEDLNSQSDDIQKRLMAINANILSSINSVRKLSGALRPSSLERLGLIEAVRDHIEKIQAMHSLSIDFTTGGMRDVRLSSDTEINIYRIIQEALNNVVKHAGARQATIRLTASHPDLLLRIEDNGAGFALQDQMNPINSGNKLGLVGMFERVQFLNGQFRIVSAPGKGTRLMIEIPIMGN